MPRVAAAEGQHAESALDAGDGEVTETSQYRPRTDRSRPLRLSRSSFTKASYNFGQCPAPHGCDPLVLTWLVDGQSGASCRLLSLPRQHRAIAESVKTAHSEVHTYPAVDVVNRTRLQEK